jgi:hypothetical protein
VFWTKSAGPSAAENRAAAEAAMEAEEAKQQAIQEKATQKKREDIGEALDMRTANAGETWWLWSPLSCSHPPAVPAGYLSRFE